MIEDTKISSSLLAEEIAEFEHKHFPNYIPLLVVGLLVAVAFVGLLLGNIKTPQVAGASTENVSANQP